MMLNLQDVETTLNLSARTLLWLHKYGLDHTPDKKLQVADVMIQKAFITLKKDERSLTDEEFDQIQEVLTTSVLARTSLWIARP